MTDDNQLRELVHRAHADDRAPSFASTLAAARRRRSPRWRIAAAFAIVAAVTTALVLWRRAPTPPPTLALGMTTTSIVTPLDSLLVIPDTGLLATTPHFDEGAIP